MKALAIILPVLLAAPAAAEDRPLFGQMICHVTETRFVAAGDGEVNRIAATRRAFAPGTRFTLGYALDADHRLSISLDAVGRRAALIDEPFAPDTFDGLSQFTGAAEYLALYSEVSLGSHGINYKGADQIDLRYCGKDRWEGHYVETHVSGLFTQVVSLTCRPSADTIGDVLDRLKVLSNRF